MASSPALLTRSRASPLTHAKRLVPIVALDDLALDELDPIVLVQDPGLAHTVVVVDGEAPTGNLSHPRLHGKDLRPFARLMQKYT